MSVSVPEEVAAVADAMIKFVDREVVPLEQANRELLSSERNVFGPDGRFVDEVLALRKQVRMRSAELGFYNLFGLEELGGDGLGAQAALYLQERLNAHCGPGRLLVQTVVLPSPFTNGLSPILRHLAPQTLAQYRDGLASGEKTMCFGLSEPDAGSDVFAMKTRARREGDEWVIDGTKQWITNAPYADYAMIFAVTDEALARERKGGLTGFFVDTRQAGFSVPSVIPTMGHLGAEIGIVSLNGVRVPDSHRLGAVDKGLAVAIGGVNVGRLAMAGTCVGLARWAVEQTLAYSKVRKTFGKPIAEHQAIQMMLADSALDIYSMKSMAQNCAARIDAGEQVVKEVAMTKAYSTEAVYRVMDRCIQAHGAMGLTNELRLEDGFRLARTMRIPDGTSEILRRTIALRMLAGDVEF